MKSIVKILGPMSLTLALVGTPVFADHHDKNVKSGCKDHSQCAKGECKTCKGCKDCKDCQKGNCEKCKTGNCPDCKTCHEKH
jgi:hypothetical protein